MAYDEDKARLEEENRQLKAQLAQFQGGEQLQRQVDEVRTSLRTPTAAPNRANPPREAEPDPGALRFTHTQASAAADLWPAIRALILSDPHLHKHVLTILATQPEIVVEIEPRQQVLDGATPRGRLARVIAEGFCDVGKKAGEIRAEINRVGTEIVSSRMSEYLDDFVTQGFLSRTEGGRYIKPPGVKATTKHITVDGER